MPADRVQRTEANLQEQAQALIREFRRETGEITSVETKGTLVVDENYTDPC